MAQEIIQSKPKTLFEKVNQYKKMCWVLLKTLGIQETSIKSSIVMTTANSNLLNKMRYYLKNLFFIIPFLAQAQYPVPVETVLKKAGSNRMELEKAIEYCSKSGDSLKVQAIYFLITNMDIHSSSDYYWEDATGKKIDYNELDYSDFTQAKTAFETLKEQNPGLNPKAVIYKDVETIKGDYLIENLEKAFVAWRTSAIKNISFDDFCEYILPYRISEEPIQQWRTTYNEKFEWIKEQIPSKGFKTVLYSVKDNYETWFTNWGEPRKEPLPKLGSMQLLFRKLGSCADIANLGVFTMRSQGIPATVNVIPFWATATGGHFMNAFFDDAMQPVNCDFGPKDYITNIIREPAKVLRLTYSRQPETLASLEDKNEIPKGMLQQQNYIDVTPYYWKTTDVKCSLYSTSNTAKVVYATTFNGLAWRPFWWGKIEKGQTSFKAICKETVLIPQYYINGKLIPAGAPVIVGDKEPQVLLPNLAQTRDVSITEADKYLKFKMGVTYKLYYWSNGWKLVDSREVTTTTTSMLFTKVPKNALLLFLASDTKGFERPFVMDDNGVRTWY